MNKSSPESSDSDSKDSGVPQSAPSTAQQYPQSGSAVRSLSQVLLSLPELSSGLPELPLGQSEVLLHCLPKLLPHLSCCFSDYRSCSPSGLPVSLLLQGTSGATKPERPPSSAWQPPSLLKSTSWFSGCHHYRPWWPSYHRSNWPPLQ